MDMDSRQQQKKSWSLKHIRIMLTAAMKTVMLFIPFMLCYASANSQTDDFTVLHTVFYMCLLLLKCAWVLISALNRYLKLLILFLGNIST